MGLLLSSLVERDAHRLPPAEFIEYREQAQSQA